MTQRDDVKVVVFTYDRWASATTPKILRESGIRHKVVCHTEEAARKYQSCGTVPKDDILVSGVEKGLANNRNWYARNHLKYGDVVLMLVDDIYKFTVLDQYAELSKRGSIPVSTGNSTEWSRKFRTVCGANEFIQMAVETLAHGDSIGASVCGFAGFDNPLFRKNKWKRNALADGRAWIMRWRGIEFDPQAQMIDDVAYCARNIACGFQILVNQWVLPHARRYTAGAYGSIEQRMPQRMAECKYLVGKYPHIIQYAKKAGWPSGGHIRLKHLSDEKWANAYAWHKKRKYT